MADITTFDVTPAYAPNGPSSPSWPGYVDNAIDALMGGSPPGRASDPEGYEEVTTMFVDPAEATVTQFNSWRGTAFPSSPFDAELGNRIHFGLAMVTDAAMQISLDRLSFNMQWVDKATGGLSTSSIIKDPITAGAFNNRDYDGNFVGVVYVNGDPGQGVMTVYDAGNPAPGNTLVDAIFYVGTGDAITPDPPGTGQSDIDDLLAAFLDPGHPQQQLCTTYTYTSPDGSTVSSEGCVMFVPEPSSLIGLLGGLGYLGLGVWRRRGA